MQRICVAWDDTPHSHWALTFAAGLAQASGSRLIVAHVAAPAECELIDLGERGRARRTLLAATAEWRAAPRVLEGRAAEQLAALACAERADLLVSGTRPLDGAERWFAVRLRHALLAYAPCPVALVRRPAPARPGSLLGCGEAAETAAALASALKRALVLERAPALLSACRRDRPLLAVIGRERAHGLRRRLRASPADALIEQAGCPVVIVP